MRYGAASFKTRLLPQNKQMFEVSENGMKEEGGGQRDGVAMRGSRLPDLTEFDSEFHRISRKFEILNIYHLHIPWMCLCLYFHLPNVHKNTAIETQILEMLQAVAAGM